LCLLAAVLDRPQQLRINARQSRQGLSIQSIVFSAALRDELYLPWIGHDNLMPKTPQQAAHPGRMGPDFDGDPGPPSGTKPLHHSFARGDLPLSQDFPFAA